MLLFEMMMGSDKNASVSFPSSVTEGASFTWTISNGTPGEGFWVTTTVPDGNGGVLSYGSSSSYYAVLDGSGNYSITLNWAQNPNAVTIMAGTRTVNVYFQYSATVTKTVVIGVPTPTVTFPTSQTEGIPFNWSIAGGIPGEGYYITTNAPSHLTYGSISSYYGTLNGSGAASITGWDFMPNAGTFTVTIQFQFSNTVTKTIVVSIGAAPTVTMASTQAVGTPITWTISGGTANMGYYVDSNSNTTNFKAPYLWGSSGNLQYLSGSGTATNSAAPWDFGAPDKGRTLTITFYFQNGSTVVKSLIITGTPITFTTTLNSVCYHSSYGYNEPRNIAVGDGGAILYSLDGLTWNVGSSGVTTKLRYVFSYGAGFGIVAVGDAGVVLYNESWDATGATWRPAPVFNGSSHTVYGVTYNGNIPEYYFCGYTGSVGFIYKSRDINWAGATKSVTWSPSAPAATVTSIVYDGTTYVAVCSDGKIYTSTDGNTFTKRSSSTTSGTDINSALYSVASASGTFLTTGVPSGTYIVRGSNPSIYTNMNVWQPHGSGQLTNTTYNQVYYDGGSTFLFVGNGGAVGWCYSSINAGMADPAGTFTMVSPTSINTNTLNGIARIPQSGINYVAIGASGTIIKGTVSNWSLINNGSTVKGVYN